MTLINALYDRNQCVISCTGSVFTGFALTAGIRQGCPLSLLLFVVVVDLLLRTLEPDIPDALGRSLANDTAMVPCSNNGHV